MISPSYMCSLHFWCFKFQSDTILCIIDFEKKPISLFVCLMFNLIKLSCKLKYDAKTKLQNIDEEEQLLFLTNKK